MKATIAIAAAAATALVLYTYFKKKQVVESLSNDFEKFDKHDKHRLTRAFAKAKRISKKQSSNTEIKSNIDDQAH